MLGESFQNLKAYLGGGSCAKAAGRMQTGEMDAFDETLEADPLHASNLEESMAPSKFLEMQERHDASHGRHLNESLRKIFNRNANQTEVRLLARAGPAVGALIFWGNQAHTRLSLAVLPGALA